jgi:DNA-binding NarL/FixJ family response regulator
VTAEKPEPRVLLGPLGALVRLGVSSTLSMHGDVEIVGEEDEVDAAVSAAGRLAPDVIILGGSSRASRALSARLRAAAPEAKLIFCPTDERIEVLDPGASTTRRCPATAADGLRFELSRRHVNAQE